MIIRTVGLAKRYGGVEAVRDLNLTLRAGEIYGFLGPNGAGKTTTLRMLLGTEWPTAGRIELFGQPAPVDPFTTRRRIGVVGEQQYLYDDMSAWEYLMFFGRLYGVGRPEGRAQVLLERLGLWDFRRLRARDHSRGMQQKLGLARALLHAPDLLVLDEPVSGLDPHGIRQVREILLEENARGTTILISSHILSEVERTAHRVGILYGGRLVAEDTVAGIGARLRPDTSIEVDVDRFTPKLVESLRAQPFVRRVDLARNGALPEHGRLRIAVAPDGDHRSEVSALIAAHGGLITEMRQQRVSLEEAFIRLTTENVAPAFPVPPSPLPMGEGQREGARGEEAASQPNPEATPSAQPSPIGRGRDVAASPAGGVGDMTVSPAGGVGGITASRAGGEGVTTAWRAGSEANTAAWPTGGGSAPARWRARLRSLRVVQRRDLLGTLFGPGVYLAVAMGMVAALVLVRSHLDAIERAHVVILSDAFTLPFFGAATIAMFFLALSSAASIAREREQGTLEVLFYGPVDHVSYVLAKHTGQLLAYGPTCLAIGLLLLAYSAMTGLLLGSAFPFALLLSLFTAAAVAALGIFLSTLTRGVRGAFALLGALTVLFLGIHVGAEALTGIPVTNNLSPLLFLRNLVIGLDALTGYVSPFGVFQNGVDALVRDNATGYVAEIGLAILQCAVLLAASVRLLARRGMRR